MKPRLASPVLAVLVGGALVAGIAVTGSPAYANPDSSTADTLSAEPSVEEPTVETPATESGELETDTTAPVTSEPVTDPAVTDPVVTDPPVTDPPVTEPVITDPEPPAADTTKPTGSFRINHTSAWAGQQITVGQAAGEFSDPVDAADTLTRVVSWGDGTSTVLSPTTFSATKAYNRAGNFSVSVTVTDPAGNQSAIPARTVGVTVPTGKLSLSKKAAYQGTRFSVNVAKVPAGATGMRIDWSDGWVSTHKARTGSIYGSVHYMWKWDGAAKRYVRVGNTRLSGARVVKVSWGNAKGYALPQSAGWINIVKDGWKPSLTITKPSGANRAASWKTVKGTVSDKGSGLRHVGVTVTRVTSTGKWYCLTPNRKWKRVYNDAAMAKYCYTTGVKVKVVKGKWTLKVPAGISRNQRIWVDAWAYDAADNFRGKYRTALITR